MKRKTKAKILKDGYRYLNINKRKLKAVSKDQFETLSLHYGETEVNKLFYIETFESVYIPRTTKDFNKTFSRKKRKKTKLLKFADELEKNLPNSEIWFREIYHKCNLKDKFDEYNRPFEHYIPDIINHRYKYIIEIDGSIHDLENIKKRDIKKDFKFKSKGYQVIRVIAYNINSLIDCIRMVYKIRNNQIPVSFIEFCKENYQIKF